ncbi:CoA transferase [Yinghuangia aomiensis]
MSWSRTWAPAGSDRLGLGYDAVSGRHPGIVYLSITGFGADGESPYAHWPAYAGVAEAMSGIYEHARTPGRPPVINPMGGLGDTGTGMFGVIGVLAALRQQEHTGHGQFVDVAMYDAMIAICDIVPNFWSLGVRRDPDAELRMPYILSSFRAGGRWCYVQVSREHQFQRLARLLDREAWLTDPRFADRFGWHDHWAEVIRPALEHWAKDLSATAAAEQLAASGITAAPCNSAEDVVHDPQRRAAQHAGGHPASRRSPRTGPRRRQPRQDVAAPRLRTDGPAARRRGHPRRIDRSSRPVGRLCGRTGASGCHRRGSPHSRRPARLTPAHRVEPRGSAAPLHPAAPCE